MYVRELSGRKWWLVSLAAIMLSAPVCSEAQVFQWTDGRGVIHFTDNPTTIPDSIRTSSRLVVRTDLKLDRVVTEARPTQETPAEESVVEAAPFPEPAPAKSEPDAAPPPVIHYSPRQVTIIVVNTAVRRDHRSKCLLPEGCRGVFRPSFEDRRYIHPSAFDGGSR
jgi:hypothetical protein